MMANAGDMDQGEEEMRTVRLVEPAQDDLSLEDVTMDIDRDKETEEREGAMARGRGRNNRRYLDD